MPPQQTKLASDTEEIAPPGRDVSIATAGSASFKADAEGPIAASTRRVLSLLVRYWHAYQDRVERRSAQASLRDLSERNLVDIGIAPGDIAYIAALKTLDKLKDGSVYPFRGGM